MSASHNHTAAELHTLHARNAMQKFVSEQNIALIMAAKIGEQTSGSIAASIMKVVQLAQSGQRFY